MTNKEQALYIYAVELYIQKLFNDRVIGGTVHLSFGQELIDSTVISCLKNPMVFGNHRSHGQFLAATNNNIESLIIQILDNRTQHLYYPGKFLSTGIQGALLPTALGYAMTNKQPVVCFIGDGTLGQGVLYETLAINSMNKKTNILYVVIDNMFSMSKTKCTLDILGLGKTFGLPVNVVYNYNTEKTEEKIKSCIKSDRFESLILYCCSTRASGHSCNDTQMYRPREERTIEFRDRNVIAFKEYSDIFKEITIDVEKRIDRVIESKNK